MYLSIEHELLIEEIQQFLDNADHFKQINRQTNTYHVAKKCLIKARQF